MVPGCIEQGPLTDVNLLRRFNGLRRVAMGPASMQVHTISRTPMLEIAPFQAAAPGYNSASPSEGALAHATSRVVEATVRCRQLR